jgi:hypothetical protein
MNLLILLSLSGGKCGCGEEVAKRRGEGVCGGGEEGRGGEVVKRGVGGLRGGCKEGEEA